ncbi:hypothetical protein ASD8599_03961 [Ascidiaceihabitans donghaensis]|uniref:FHA domain-containing protein n=1 Tax=Ascidiaceihabitans donghaensis TaxID=1510460 RepID=A0A2R8BPJ4_9RHOB|nr:type VI secretion system-associated FHA domain protein TagH [Ascidiaceihabitans donghaensis]SPH27495.1 hypothetical protein ASD8599_03961 [Ascidiaceihabitans donghaensis]
MTLTLQIENYDMLDDGGPAQFSVTGQGAQIGRASVRDWTLPDPTKHISGHHFNILFQDGAYFLQDVSTNGTFLQGSRYRLEQPHRLNSGDRFQVGPYYIVAHIQSAAQAAPPAAQANTWAPAAAATPAASGDPWDMGGHAAPVDVAPQAPTARREDFADDFIANPVSMPPVTPQPLDDDPFALPSSFDPAPAAPQGGGNIQMPAHLTTPPQAMPTPAPIAAPPMPTPAPQPAPQPIPQAAPQPVPQAAPQPPLDAPIYTNPTAPPVEMPVPGAPAPLAAAPRPDAAQMARPDPIPVPAAAPAMGSGQNDVVRAFCEAAGISPDAYGDVDPVELARALGQSTRHVAGELMTLLQVRDAAKQFTRGGERTMRRNSDNNPLKFLPDAEQAIEAMYLKHRAGFLKGPEGVAEALRDVRVHQTAVFAAIQPALAQLLTGLYPEEIEESAGSGGGMLGSVGGGKRTKAWETFVERWDQKTSPHENGMLGEFLVHFAKAYADVVGNEGS